MRKYPGLCKTGKSTMGYHSRIPADPAYIEALGRAFYNFTYLEWIVVWTIVKLSPDGFGSVPRGESASHIAGALIRAIAATSPPLSQGLRHSLVKFHEAYRGAIRSRNKLLHAHPYTATGGLQQLRGGRHDWLCLRLRRGCGVRGWGRDDLGTGARGRGARARRALMSTTRCACGSSGAAVCGAGGVMTWARGRGEGARGRGGR
jgi:hypothetical protein